MCSAALDHNPQQIYSDNPEKLISIFVSWFVVVFIPLYIVFSFFRLLYVFELYLRNK
jgi:hypothetical protein